MSDGKVAARAGVSRGTASRVINNAPHVSRAARAAVERVVRELGYVPNTAARSLVTQRAGAVVLAVSAADPALFAEPFFAEVIVGVNAVLEVADLELSLVLAASVRGRARLRHILAARRADGLMLLALRGKDPLRTIVRGAGVPVVYGGRPFGPEPAFYVDADNRGGARQAVEYLIATGRRRIATITGPLDTAPAVARFDGYRDAMAAAGNDQGRVAHGDFTEIGGADAMSRLLTHHGDLDAVFAASDAMAAGALRTLKEGGRVVPEEVALVGFNDVVTARLTNPALTTIHQPVTDLGREMARMLLAVIDGEHPTPLILPTHLVIRDSA